MKGTLRHGVGVAAAVVATALSAMLSALASATLKYGDVEISGNFETQNLIRHPDIDEVQFIQNRNTVRVRIDWKWLKDGRFIDKFDVPWIRRARLFLLYRGVYDGFYDIAPGGNQVGQAVEDDRIGGPIIGNRIGTCLDPATGKKLAGADCGPGTVLRPGRYSRYTENTRDTLKFENILREAYVDLTLRDVPLNLRIGRQQVVWGEADQFRLADIWNPLDVSWRFPIGDTFDEFRVPLWLVKGLWKFGSVDLGPLGQHHNTFVEFVWNPFDFQPGQKIDWLPRPHSLPFANPLRQGQIWAIPVIPGLVISPTFDLQGTSFKRGRFKRNIEDATELGIRLHSMTSFGLEWTINYIYGRGKWLANSPALGVKIRQIGPVDVVGATPPLGTFSGFPVRAAPVIAEVVHPYNHIWGFTGNFFDSAFTNAVIRWEAAYAKDEPFATSEEESRPPILGVPGVFSPVGFDKRDVLAFMIGMDRPTWIRWLNRRGTWFLTMQAFGVVIPWGDPDKLHGFSSARRAPYFTPTANQGLPGADTGGFGVWDGCTDFGVKQGHCFAGTVERIQNALVPPDDNYSRFESMITFAATTAYKGGSVQPQFIWLFDPFNLWMAPQLQLQYAYTNDFIITLQSRVIIPMHPPTNDPWFVGRFGRRSETGIIVKYQF